MMVHASSSSLQRPLLRVKATTLKKWFTLRRATAIPPPPRGCGFDEATTKTTNNAKKKTKLLKGGGKGGDVHPLSFSGCKLCANFAMVSYWDCGVQGFFDATARPNMETPGVFGLEFVVAKDPERLRQTALSTCTIDEEERDKRTWLDYDYDDALVDDDDDDAKEETGEAGGGGKVKPESRALIVSLRDPNWILVTFRGTTPNPSSGFFRESKINGRAGQVAWKDCPERDAVVKVHAGYANAYGIVRDRVERDVTERVKRKIEEGGDVNAPPRVVITGHSLGGAMATLCAARLGNSEEMKRLGVKTSLITFGQPRVGDGNFKKLFDKKETTNNVMDGYLRIVNEQDVFARVPPKSGIWIPDGVLETSLSSSIDASQWTFSYEHAGDCVWYRDDGRILFREEPKGVSLRTVNPVSIALDHAKYAKLFDDEQTKKNFPRAVCFHPERQDPKTICINCPDPKNDFRRNAQKSASAENTNTINDN
jgi:hypothetical protein